MNILLFFHRVFKYTIVGVFLTISLVIPQNTGIMAGKVYVLTGEKVSISLAEIPYQTNISWTLSKEGTIIETKTGKSYSSSFTSSGEYLLRVSALGKDGFQSATVIDISVGASLPNFSPLKAVIKTIPEADHGILSLAGQEAKVTFSFLDSTGEIESYSLEGDVYSDADGDGVIDNDIENKNDISFHSGSYFQKTYKNDGIPKKAILTVKNKKGETTTSSVMIRFTEGASKASLEKQQKPLSANLQSIPKSNAQGAIAVSGKPSTVLLYGSQSEGKIIEYRIDINDKEDSNKDGNATNDPDNANTDSITTGSVFPLQVSSSTLPKTITLSVIDASGTMKSVQKTIIVDENASSAGPNSGSEFLTPMLFASRSKIPAGESVIFKLFNIAPESNVSWDFNGDGKWDIEKSTDTEVEFKYSDGGTFNVRAEITQVGSTPILTKAVVEVIADGKTKIKTDGPNSHFLAQKEGNKVSFLSSESTADENLVDTNLSYNWDFGDGYKTEGPNPVHVYEKAGLYTVSLMVEDSIERQAMFTDNIEITEIITPFDAKQHGGPASFLETIKTKAEDVIDSKTLPQTEEATSLSSSESSSEEMMIPWWLALIILLPFLPLLYLIKLKIDNPEKTFTELSKESITKIKAIFHPKPKEEEITLESLGIQKSEENNQETNQQTSQENTKKVVNNEENKGEETPSWMRNYDDQEIQKASNFDSPLVDDAIENTSGAVGKVIPEISHENIQEEINDSETEINTENSENGNDLEENTTEEEITEETTTENTEINKEEGQERVQEEEEMTDTQSQDEINDQEETVDETQNTNIQEDSQDNSQEEENIEELEENSQEETISTITEEEILEEEKDIFSTQHPEWLKEILIETKTPFYEEEENQEGENLSPKEEWNENDSDEILGITNTSPNIQLPDIEENNDDEWWETNDEWWNADTLEETQNETTQNKNIQEEHGKIENNEPEMPTKNSENSNFEKNISENSETKGEEESINIQEDDDEEETPIKAINANIPLKEDSSKVPTWMQG